MKKNMKKKSISDYKIKEKWWKQILLIHSHTLTKTTTKKKKSKDMVRYEWDVKKMNRNQTDGKFKVNINYLKGKQNIYHDNDISKKKKNLYV